MLGQIAQDIVTSKFIFDDERIFNYEYRYSEITVRTIDIIDSFFNSNNEDELYSMFRDKYENYRGSLILALDYDDLYNRLNTKPRYGITSVVAYFSNSLAQCEDISRKIASIISPTKEFSEKESEIASITYIARSTKSIDAINQYIYLNVIKDKDILRAMEIIQNSSSYDQVLKRCIEINPRLGSIAGPVAENVFEMPEKYLNSFSTYLPKEYLDTLNIVLKKFYHYSISFIEMSKNNPNLLENKNDNNI